MASLRPGSRILFGRRPGVVVALQPANMVDIRLDGESLVQRRSADRLSPLRENPRRPLRHNGDEPPHVQRLREALAQLAASEPDLQQRLAHARAEHKNVEAVLARLEGALRELAQVEKPTDADKALAAHLREQIQAARADLAEIISHQHDAERALAALPKQKKQIQADIAAAEGRLTQMGALDTLQRQVSDLEQRSAEIAAAAKRMRKPERIEAAKAELSRIQEAIAALKAQGAEVWARIHRTGSLREAPLPRAPQEQKADPAIAAQRAAAFQKERARYERLVQQRDAAQATGASKADIDAISKRIGASLSALHRIDPDAALPLREAERAYYQEIIATHQQKAREKRGEASKDEPRPVIGPRTAARIAREGGTIPAAPKAPKVEILTFTPAAPIPYADLALGHFAADAYLADLDRIPTRAGSYMDKERTLVRAWAEAVKAEDADKGKGFNRALRGAVMKARSQLRQHWRRRPEGEPESPLQQWMDALESEAKLQKQRVPTPSTESQRRQQQMAVDRTLRQRQKQTVEDPLSVIQREGAGWTLRADVPRISRLGQVVCGNPIDGHSYVVTLSNKRKSQHHWLSVEDVAAAQARIDAWKAKQGSVRFAPTDARGEMVITQTRREGRDEPWAVDEAIESYTDPTRTMPPWRLTHFEFTADDLKAIRAGQRVAYQATRLGTSYELNAMGQVVRRTSGLGGRRMRDESRPRSYFADIPQPPRNAFIEEDPDRPGVFIAFYLSRAGLVEAVKLGDRFTPRYAFPAKQRSPFFSWNLVSGPLRTEADRCLDEEETKFLQKLRTYRALLLQLRRRLRGVHFLLESLTSEPFGRPFDVPQPVSGPRLARALADLQTAAAGVLRFVARAVAAYTSRQSAPDGSLGRAEGSETSAAMGALLTREGQMDEWLVDLLMGYEKAQRFEVRLRKQDRIGAEVQREISTIHQTTDALAARLHALTRARFITYVSEDQDGRNEVVVPSDLDALIRSMESGQFFRGPDEAVFTRAVLGQPLVAAALLLDSPAAREKDIPVLLAAHNHFFPALPSKPGETRERAAPANVEELPEGELKDLLLRHWRSGETFYTWVNIHFTGKAQALQKQHARNPAIQRQVQLALQILHLSGAMTPLWGENSPRDAQFERQTYLALLLYLWPMLPDPEQVSLLIGAVERLDAAIMGGQSIQKLQGFTTYYTYNPLLFHVAKNWWRNPQGWPAAWYSRNGQTVVCAADVLGRYGVAMSLYYGATQKTSAVREISARLSQVLNLEQALIAAHNGVLEARLGEMDMGVLTLLLPHNVPPEEGLRDVTRFVSAPLDYLRDLRAQTQVAIQAARKLSREEVHYTSAEGEEVPLRLPSEGPLTRMQVGEVAQKSRTDVDREEPTALAALHAHSGHMRTLQDALQQEYSRLGLAQRRSSKT